MSRQDYTKALELINQHKDREISSRKLVRVTGDIPEKHIQYMEEVLGYALKESLYGHFLVHIGDLSFGSIEIDGIFRKNDTYLCIALDRTLKAHEEGDLPKNLLIIQDGLFAGERICLDLSKKNDAGEYPVVARRAGGSEMDPTYEKLAEDFGEYLLHQLEEEIQYLKEEGEW